MKTIILILFSLNLCIGQSDTIVTLGYIDTAPDQNLKDTVKVIMFVSDTTRNYEDGLMPLDESQTEYILLAPNSYWKMGYIIKSEPSYMIELGCAKPEYKPFYNKQEFHSLDFKPLNPNLIVWDYKEIK